MGLPNPSRETKFSGANENRKMSLFPVQLTTSRVGNLSRLIHTLARCMTIHTSTSPCRSLCPSPRHLLYPSPVLHPLHRQAMSPQEPMSNPLTPMPPRVSRELEHNGYVEIPGRTRGETRALRAASLEYAHNHGDHVAMVSMLAKGEQQNEAVR